MTGGEHEPGKIIRSRGVVFRLVFDPPPIRTEWLVHNEDTLFGPEWDWKEGWQNAYIFDNYTEAETMRDNLRSEGLSRVNACPCSEHRTDPELINCKVADESKRNRRRIVKPSDTYEEMERRYPT